MNSAGDVARLSSHHMSDPSPSPSHDDGAHAVLFLAGEKILVGDGLGQECSVEGGKFVEVAFSHPPAF